MKARYTIGHRAYVTDSVDDLGNAVDEWLPAVDLKVFSLAPTASLADSEPTEPSRSAVVTGMTALVPRGTALGPHDHYVINGEEWEQEGEVGDYTRGPFRNRVGHLVLTLKRVEG